MLGYLDCRLMVAGTRLFMAKEKIGSELRYARYRAVVKTDEIANKAKTSFDDAKKDIKDKVDNIKTKMAEKKSAKTEESSKMADTVVETVEFTEKSSEDEAAEEVKDAIDTVIDAASEAAKNTDDPSEIFRAAMGVATEHAEEINNSIKETVDKMDIRVEDIQGMNIPVTSEEEKGPDFTLLRGVTYDPEEDNLVYSDGNIGEPIVKNMDSNIEDENTRQHFKKPVTVEDLEIALNKEKAARKAAANKKK